MAWRRRTRDRCFTTLNGVLFVLLAHILLMPGLMGANDLPRHTVRCDDRAMEYVMFVPPGAANEKLPVLLLLHGAGDQAANFIQAWGSLARKEKIVLIAPQLPRELSFEAVAPKIFRCVVADADKGIHFDPQRIYLFGHSMGGYLAYDGALLDSGYYAAAAIHAMGIEDDYTSIVGRATRKIPIAIFTGDKDELVSLRMVHKTRDLLKKSGFPVEYHEIMDHGHNYYELSDSINHDVWKFLKEYRLP
jgi:predicted esterase